MSETKEHENPVTRDDGVTFRVNDTVKVVKDTGHQIIRTLSFWGFIESFWEDENGGNNLIQLRCLDGHGAGSIPIDCIEHHNTPEAKRAKESYDAEQEKLRRYYDARAELSRKKKEQFQADAKAEMDRIAERLGATPELIGKAISDFEEWKKGWTYQGEISFLNTAPANSDICTVTPINAK